MEASDNRKVILKDELSMHDELAAKLEHEASYNDTNHGSSVNTRANSLTTGLHRPRQSSNMLPSALLNSPGPQIHYAPNSPFSYGNPRNFPIDTVKVHTSRRQRGYSDEDYEQDSRYMQMERHDGYYDIDSAGNSKSNTLKAYQSGGQRGAPSTPNKFISSRAAHHSDQIGNMSSIRTAHSYRETDLDESSGSRFFPQPSHNHQPTHFSAYRSPQEHSSAMYRSASRPTAYRKLNFDDIDREDSQPFLSPLKNDDDSLSESSFIKPRSKPTPGKSRGLHHHAHHHSHGKSSASSLDADDFSSRNARGLRILSQQVKEIMHHLKEASYKEVANTLISRFYKKERSSRESKHSKSDDGGNREEQNIKRRAYDALNVLIAADVLLKKGKKVVFNEEVLKRPSYPEGKAPSKVKKDLEHHLQARRQAVHDKKLRLRDSVLKYLSIQNLLKRNKDHGVTATNAVIAANGLVPLPFIVVKQGQDASVDLTISKDLSKLSISSNRDLDVYGDLDTLVRLKFFDADPTAVTRLPREIIKYLKE